MPPSGCAILSGVLHDPYTGKDIQFNRDEGTDVLVQIDHVVPLLDAWETGAQQWDVVKRTRFANDPLDLLAVSGKANRKKKAGLFQAEEGLKHFDIPDDLRERIAANIQRYHDTVDSLLSQRKMIESALERPDA